MRGEEGGDRKDEEELQSFELCVLEREERERGMDFNVRDVFSNNRQFITSRAF